MTDQERKAWRLMDAIEAFTQAKIDYARSYERDPSWAGMNDVNETRDHLITVLGEVL
jgi:hypothetical protein